MNTQTNLDLRARFAQLAETENEQAAPERPQHPLETATNVFTGQGPVPERRRPQRAVCVFRASPKQINMIRDMLHERYTKTLADEMFSKIDWTPGTGITRLQFDDIFQGLKKTPRLDQPVQTEAAPAAKVPAPERLMEGIFTVEFEDGSYQTLRVRRQNEDTSFMPGALLVGFLSGSDNVSDYTNFAHVLPNGFVKIWKKHQGNTKLIESVKVLRGDQIACAKAYARHSDHCSFCNRPLTTPESLDAGWGKKCAEDRGLPWG